MIRVILGLIIVMSGVGGIETSTDDFELFYSALIASFGILVMYIGVNTVKE